MSLEGGNDFRSFESSRTERCAESDVSARRVNVGAKCDIDFYSPFRSCICRDMSVGTTPCAKIILVRRSYN